jgi:hypothetical protein
MMIVLILDVCSQSAEIDILERGIYCGQKKRVKKIV